MIAVIHSRVWASYTYDGRADHTLNMAVLGDLV